MNIAFFLLPKKDVVYLKTDSTMRQALERMEYHLYSTVPLIDDDGKYVGVLTEGDLLSKMKNTPGLTFMNTEKIYLDEIKRHTQYNPVSVNTQMENLIVRAAEQNFIPVVDDNGIFIGIICRSELIRYSVDCINPSHNFTLTKIKDLFSGNSAMRSLCLS
ncbi:MAG: CBS domain-containing protein [Desulfosporosinus sp.]|nr:CBS domain-containing protein [Desulfosporosinus sp.]